ncbi:MAG: hypothetical protein KUG77_09745 [Nannocystaceae bacterium]|nr:hypothetical protein [Nannocystaceae bacterium]
MTEPFDSAPPPRHSALEAMLVAARAQSAPRVTVTVDDVRAASMRRSWRRWGGGVAAAIVLASLWAAAGRSPAEATVALGEPPQVARLADVPLAAVRDDVVVPSEPQSPVSPRSVTPVIDPLGDAEPPVVGEGDVVALVSGQYRIQTLDAAMTVSVAGRVLEISVASEVIVDASLEQHSFRVVKGEAGWSTSQDAGPARGADTKSLATRAEAALVSGRLEEAVRLLRKLVSSRPRGAATKAAIIDLARLEKKLGRPRRAHCAYALFSKRFPTDARTPTVLQADEALGVTSLCRGLRPSSK